MEKILLKEILILLLTVLLVSFTSFIILYYISGSVTTIQYGFELDAKPPEVETTLLHTIQEYYTWLKNVTLHNNWGYSEISKESVWDIIIPKWQRSLLLAFISMGITILLAIVWCWIQEYCSHRSRARLLVNRILLKSFNIIEFILLSFIPVSLALVVLSIVSSLRISLVRLNEVQQFILPILVLVLLQLPLFIRSLRASINQIKKQKFIDFAYSLGFSSRWVWWREIIPNAFLFTLTLSVVQLSYLIGGSIIIERIFLFPGLGYKLIDAVLQRDKVLVHAIVVVVSFAVMGLHVVTVLLQRFLYGKEIHE